MDFIFDIKMYKEAKESTPAENYDYLMNRPIEVLQKMFPEYYEEWVKFLGGEKNLFLTIQLETRWSSDLDERPYGLQIDSWQPPA